ncbi:hypothetical protein AQ611_17090 [Burkholderia singularis]|nr:hypothetical protein AQ611_17090 [Burkholderia sp. Bp7605]
MIGILPDAALVCVAVAGGLHVRLDGAGLPACAVRVTCAHRPSSAVATVRSGFLLAFGVQRAAARNPSDGLRATIENANVLS